MLARTARLDFARFRARWAWQPDRWERLTTVARCTGDARTVLDVGGRGGEMACLLPRASVYSVNLEPPADLVVPAGPLPFDTGSVDAITSSDVLEHVPAEDRPAHVAELVRVARHRLVLGFPCGSPQKAASEARLAATLRDEFGVSFDFLDEHLANGLPTPDEVVAMVMDVAPEAEVSALFQDDFEAGDRLLVDAVRAYRGRQLGAFLRVARAWALRRPPELGSAQLPTSNRVYLVIELPAASGPGSARVLR